MRRATISALIAAAMLAAPASAAAASYTWSMPTDFTGAHNPDPDAYGGTPWSYLQGAPGSFTPLPGPATNGGRTGWFDGSGNAFVAGTAGSVVEMQSDSSTAVALAWTSPFSTSRSVSVSFTPTFTGHSLTCPTPAAPRLEDQNGSPIGSATPTVPAHGGIYVVLAKPQLLESGCTFSIGLQISAGAPTLRPTLTAPAPGAIVKAGQPTFTGTGGTDFGQSKSVTVDVYRGASATGSPLESLTASVAGDGSFSASPSPALADGQYTVQATQSNNLGDHGSGPAVTFSIKTHAPVVTLSQPTAGTATTNTRPTFSGGAGTVFGDSRKVTITLYKGSAAAGKPLGTATATPSGADWSARWPHTLSPGTYTARATQTDDAGHTGMSAPDTFRIVPGPIGQSVGLSRTGIASLQLTCTAAPGQTCAGTVLVLTVRHYQPVAGGPKGAVRVLFAYVDLAGGTTETLRRPVPGFVVRMLRRKSPLEVRVTLRWSGASRISAQRRLQT